VKSVICKVSPSALKKPGTSDLSGGPGESTMLTPGTRAAHHGGGDLGIPPRPAEVTYHLYPRPQRRGALVLPAGSSGHRRSGSTFGSDPGQACLTDTWLAGEQHDPAGPGRSLGD